ncbi:Aldedh-domain-containing protein [Mrakia frigida]|uniref:meiotic recombination directing protein n=1 Tax=Mrakia frigida TaxID=29902 RepID=UPI003FCC1009
MIIDTADFVPSPEVIKTTLLTAAGLAFGLVLSRWLARESKDARTFPVHFPPESSSTWKGPKLAHPSITSHLDDASLLPPSSNKNDKFITCFDPASNMHIATLPADSSSTINAKVLKADAAQKSWGKTTFRERRAVLRSLMVWITRDLEEISKVGVRDTGKTMLDSAFGEIITTCSKLEWLIKHGEEYLRPESRAGNLILSHKSAKVHYEPLGTVAACVSWNYPFHNSLSQISAALFSGNSLVLKCSEQVAWSSNFFVDVVRTCLAEHGFDPEVLQLVICYPEEAAALTEHEKIRHITFIGSEQVARKVALSATKNLIPCTMELGGKDPAILLPSADIKQFESTFLRATFQSSGQGCIATERFIVHSSLLSTLIPRLEARISSFRLGATLAPNSTGTPVDSGAMISDARFGEFEKLVGEAVKDGARLVLGGKRWEGGKEKGVEGAFFEPTMLVGVKSSMRIAREEVFGPIMLILSYDTIDEAVEIANGSRYGLGASVYGRNKAEARDVASRLQCGMVSINDVGVFYLDQSQPFGGCKASGYGRFGGPEGLRGLCNVKAIMEDRFFGLVQTSIPSPVDFPVKSITKSWSFVSGLVRLMYGSSLLEVGQGIKEIITGSL